MHPSVYRGFSAAAVTIVIAIAHSPFPLRPQKRQGGQLYVQCIHPATHAARPSIHAIPFSKKRTSNKQIKKQRMPTLSFLSRLALGYFIHPFIIT